MITNEQEIIENLSIEINRLRHKVAHYITEARRWMAMTDAQLDLAVRTSVEVQELIDENELLWEKLNDQAKIDEALRHFEAMGPRGASRSYRHGIALAAAYRELQERHEATVYELNSLMGHIEEQNRELREALEQAASGPCCETPGCSIDSPYCDAMVARAALAKTGGEDGRY